MAKHHVSCTTPCEVEALTSHLVVSITGVVLLGIIFGMKETRSSVILTRLAKKLRKKTGDNRYRARIEDERTSLKTLIFISCTRPIRESYVVSFPLGYRHSISDHQISFLLNP